MTTLMVGGGAQALRRLAALSHHRWSSYAAYVGGGGFPEWLHAEQVLAKFGQGPRARRGYRRYVEEAVRCRWTESPWENLIGGLVLGGKELVEKVRQSTKADATKQPGWKLIGAPPFRPAGYRGRLRGEAWEDFGQRRGDWGRAMVLMAARRWAGIDNRGAGRVDGRQG